MLTLMIKTGSRYRTASRSEVCEAASAYHFAAAKGETLANPIDARRFVRLQAGLEFEQFGLITLDNRHKVISIQILFNGTIDGASVHPREVVKRALSDNAKAVMLFHNHPSGVAEPSTADEMITRRLRDALALIDVRILDHLIVAGDDCLSFAERGLI